MNEILINNESDVYDLLEKLSDKNFKLDSHSINFNNWPVLTIRMTGPQFDSSITAPVMKAFIELQASIYRSFATAKYGVPNPSKLSKEEKKELELVIKVEKGSSIFNIDAEQLLTNMVEKMNSQEIVACVLVFIVAYFGSSIWKKYLDNRKEERIAESKSKEQKALIEHLTFSSKEETKRTEILSNIVINNPKASTIVALSDDAKAELLKRASSAETFEYQGVTVTGDVAEELGRNARKPSIDIRLDGLYRVLNVDSSDPNEFKVRIRNVRNSEEFTAVVQDNTLELAHIEAIQNGEWQRKLVNMTINAKQRTKDNTIYNAKVIFADLPQDIEDVE